MVSGNDPLQKLHWHFSALSLFNKEALSDVICTCTIPKVKWEKGLINLCYWPQRGVTCRVGPGSAGTYSAFFDNGNILYNFPLWLDSLERDVGASMQWLTSSIQKSLHRIQFNEEPQYTSKASLPIFGWASHQNHCGLSTILANYAWWFLDQNRIDFGSNSFRWSISLIFTFLTWFYNLGLSQNKAEAQRTQCCRTWR